MAGSTQSETHVQFAGERSHYAGGNAEQAHLAVLLVKEEAILFFGEFLRCAAGTDDYPKPASFSQRKGCMIQTRALQRFGGCRQRERQDPRNMFTFFLLNPRQFVKCANLARDPHRNL